MAMPTVYEEGTPVHGTGVLTVPWGTHNDTFYGILLVTCAGEGTLGTPTQSGADGTWVLIDSCAAGTGAGSIQLGVYYCKATSGSMSDVDVPDSGDHTSAKMFMLQNVVGTGNPINAKATQTVTSASASISMAAFTTTVNNCMVFCFAGCGFDQATGAGGSGWSNASLDTIGFAGQYCTDNGTGGGYMGAVGEKATAGSCGTFSHTWSAGATLQANVAFAISDTATLLGLEPAAAASTSTGVTPTLAPGAMTLSPAAASGSAVGATPTVTTPSLNSGPPALFDVQAVAQGWFDGSTTSAISWFSDDFVQAGSSASTISPDASTATATGVTPSLSPGGVSAAPDPAAATSTGVTPSVTSAATISASPAASTSTGVDPALSPGAVGITASPSASTSTGADPTLSPGAVSSQPGAVASSATGVDPTLTTATTITATAAQATAAGVEPSLSPGQSTISPGAAASTSAGADPSLAPGSVSVAPAAASSTASGATPSLAAGGMSVIPDAAGSTAVGVDPSVSGGATSTSAAPASSTAAGATPTLSAGSVALSPAASASTAAGADPALSPGAVTITADPAAGSATGVDAGVTSGAVLSPAPAAGSASGVDGTLSPGAVSAEPQPSAATATAVQPALASYYTVTYSPAASVATIASASFSPGPVSLSVGPAQAASSLVDPGIQPGAVTLAVSAAASTASAVDPTATPSGVQLSVGPASATAACTTPSVLSGSQLEADPAPASASAQEPSLAPGAMTITAGPSTAEASATSPSVASSLDTLRPDPARSVSSFPGIVLSASAMTFSSAIAVGYVGVSVGWRLRASAAFLLAAELAESELVKPSGSVVRGVRVSISRATGAVTYTSAAGEIDQPGIYRVGVAYTNGSRTVRSYKRIHVRRRIADGVPYTNTVELGDDTVTVRWTVDERLPAVSAIARSELVGPGGTTARVDVVYDAPTRVMTYTASAGELGQLGGYVVDVVYTADGKTLSTGTRFFVKKTLPPRLRVRR